MQFPRLQMESQRAQIVIQQQAGKQTIQQPAARLSIEQPKATLTIKTKPSKLTIDQSQAWEEMNLMSTKQHIKKQADTGMNNALEGAGRRAEQGTQLMRIETKGNPIKDQAYVNGSTQQKRIGMKFIPSPFAVKINYERADVDIFVKVNRPTIQATRNQPELHYERGKVDIAMKQYAKLTINVAEHTYVR
ncbi:DUF6470 family protein [Virgibacillus sp. W0430]|uniref:DUF6470 family protein n=1 Tax=Virgibacillus sp. W0430 TaxID=3391580 RepID=UPI003F4626B2